MHTAVSAFRELGAASVRKYLPARPKESHKGDYGKVLLLCGSTGYTGAARLAAKAALRTGSGLIYLGVPEAVYPIVAAGQEEAIVFPLPSDEKGRLSVCALDGILERLPAMDAVLIGPGLGRSEELTQLLTLLLRECSVPVVLDADGINGLAAHKDVLRDRQCPLILTPHDGEFRRLFADSGLERRQETVRAAKELGCILLRKGHRTLITDGKTIYRNRTGNPGMAVGGSGDVLSGILVSLLGQGVPPLQAAALGAWIHGAAGDLAAKRLGEYGMLPSDLIMEIPQILK